MTHALLYSALTRLRTVSTARRAELFEDESLLMELREGRGLSNLHPALRQAVGDLDWAEAERQDLEIIAKGASLLCWKDSVYPEGLRNLADPPPALYVRGDISLLSKPSIALVGSRLSTVYGQNVARSLGEDLARAGLVVVSGLARGVDSAAHEGALAVEGGTIAVLGTGIDRVYPRENVDLFEKILRRQGAIISEYPPGTPPLARNFPVRNRIIAGLSIGVVVVEATERSGSLITARLALEGGKELFAVPHNITSGTGIGPNTLIQGGAKLVQRLEDVLEELPAKVRENLTKELLTAPEKGAGTISENAGCLLKALKSDEGLTVDELCLATGLSPREILPAALELQMAGMCVELPGARYARGKLTKEL